MSIESERLTGMLHKVRSLLDKAASDGVPEPERELLNAKAHELIARYGIDAAMLAERDPEADKVSDRIISVAPPYMMDKFYLLNEIAKPLRVLVVLLKRADGTRTAQLFGYGADLQRTEILFASLLLQAAHGLARARPVGGRESVAAFRRTWLTGFAHEVGDRLSQAENNVAADTAVSDGSRPVALVLADRSATVELALRTAHPKVRPAKRTCLGRGSNQAEPPGRRPTSAPGATWARTQAAASSDSCTDERGSRPRSYRGRLPSHPRSRIRALGHRALGRGGQEFTGSTAREAQARVWEHVDAAS